MASVKQPVIPESLIKRQIVEYLRLQGIFCWVNISGGIYDPTIGKFRKLNGYGMMKGAPDIIGIYKGGKFLGIEVKNKKGIVSPEQKYFLDEINRNGGIGFVARSIDDVIENLKQL